MTLNEVRRIHHEARETSLQHAKHISQHRVRPRRDDEAKVGCQLGEVIHQHLKSLVANRFDANASCLEIGALLRWRVAFVEGINQHDNLPYVGAALDEALPQ